MMMMMMRPVEHFPVLDSDPQVRVVDIKLFQSQKLNTKIDEIYLTVNSKLSVIIYTVKIFLGMGVEWHCMLGLMSIATSYMLIFITMILILNRDLL